MKIIIDELQNAPNIILFIDEIHQIVGAGNSSGSLDLYIDSIDLDYDEVQVVVVSVV